MTVRREGGRFRLGGVTVGRERQVSPTHLPAVFFLAGTMPSFPPNSDHQLHDKSTPKRVGDWSYEGPPGPTISPSWLVRGPHRDLTIRTPTCFTRTTTVLEMILSI